MNNKDNDNKSAKGMIFGMAIGTAIRLVAGTMSRMIYLWLPIGASVGMCLGLVIGSIGKDDYKESVIIKYNREPVCMGDDVYNDIYEIKMLGDATVYDLINIIKSGGNGNEWPTPMGFDWIVYSNIGRLAKIYSNKMKIDFYDIAPRTKLLNLGIEWVYAARETDVIDETRLESIFRD